MTTRGHARNERASLPGVTSSESPEQGGYVRQAQDLYLRWLSDVFDTRRSLVSGRIPAADRRLIDRIAEALAAAAESPEQGGDQPQRRWTGVPRP